MKGSFSGRLSNTDSLTPKFLARMDLGVWTSQSSIWNVVLFRGVFWLVNECYIGYKSFGRFTQERQSHRCQTPARLQPRR